MEFFQERDQQRLLQRLKNLKTRDNEDCVAFLISPGQSRLSIDSYTQALNSGVDRRNIMNLKQMANMILNLKTKETVSEFNDNLEAQQIANELLQVIREFFSKIGQQTRKLQKAIVEGATQKKFTEVFHAIDGIEFETKLDEAFAFLNQNSREKEMVKQIVQKLVLFEEYLGGKMEEFKKALEILKTCTFSRELFPKNSSTPNGPRRSKKAKITRKNGESYEGEWLRNQEDGFGVKIFADSSKYEGNWKQGVMSGFGKYYYLNGDVYEGEWLNGKANGQGNRYCSSGIVYKGQWKDNEKRRFIKTIRRKRELLIQNRRKRRRNLPRWLQIRRRFLKWEKRRKRDSQMG